jgi:hypothetical protein
MGIISSVKKKAKRVMRDEGRRARKGREEAAEEKGAQRGRRRGAEAVETYEQTSPERSARCSPTRIRMQSAPRIHQKTQLTSSRRPMPKRRQIHPTAKSSGCPEQRQPITSPASSSSPSPPQRNYSSCKRPRPVRPCARTRNRMSE